MGVIMLVKMFRALQVFLGNSSLILMKVDMRLSISVAVLKFGVRATLCLETGSSFLQNTMDTFFPDPFECAFEEGQPAKSINFN